MENYDINETADDFTFDEDDYLAEMRQEYVKEHKNYYIDICAGIETGDIETAARLAHTIKSSAAMIYEPALSEISAILEKLLMQGDIPDANTLKSFGDEFNKVLNNIGEVEQIVINEEDKLGIDESINLLNKVKPLVAEQSLECMDMLETLRRIPGSEEFCEKIRSYEFDEAVEELEKLLNSLA